MAYYDNRSVRARLYDRTARKLGLKPRNVGESHYIFESGGKRIAYCYIRKNASTAFKRLIIDVSPYSEAVAQCGSRIRFMDNYHREMLLDRLEACDVRMFVYRDVFQRMASLFVNKFVLRKGAGDISMDLSRRLGMPEDAVSFSAFVKNYLGQAQDVNQLDPHVWEQIYHLRPIHYTHAIAVDQLEGEMSSIIGPGLASEYFRQKVNSAGAGQGIEGRDVADMDGAALNAEWQRVGRLPSYDQLLRSDLVEVLSDIYRRDIRMLEKINR